MDGSDYHFYGGGGSPKRDEMDRLRENLSSRSRLLTDEDVRMFLRDAIVNTASDSEERALSRVKCFNSTTEDETSQCPYDEFNNNNNIRTSVSDQFDSSATSAFANCSLTSTASSTYINIGTASSQTPSTPDVNGTASSDCVRDTTSSHSISGTGTSFFHYNNDSTSSHLPSHTETTSSHCLHTDENANYFSNTTGYYGDYEGQSQSSNFQSQRKYFDSGNDTSGIVLSWEVATPSSTQVDNVHQQPKVNKSRRIERSSNNQNRKSKDPFKILRSFKDRVDNKNYPLLPDLTLAGVRGTGSTLEDKMDEVMTESMTVLRPLTPQSRHCCRTDSTGLLFRDINTRRVYLEKRADEINAFNASISVCNAALKQRLHDLKKVQKEMKKFEKEMQDDIQSLIQETHIAKKTLRSEKERSSQMERKEFLQMQQSKQLAISNINVSMQARQLQLENHRYRRELRECKKKKEKLTQDLSGLLPEGTYDIRKDLEPALDSAKRNFCNKYTEYLKTFCHRPGEQFLRTEKKLEGKANGGRMKNMHKMAKDLYGPEMLGEYYYMDFV